MCRCLFLNLLLEKFYDKDQFEFVCKYPTPKDAIDGTMDLLANLAKKHGLSDKFSFSPSKAPPHAVISQKNKSQKEIKLRILFSHFNHPGKEWGRKIGRALPLLIKTAKEIV